MRAISKRILVVVAMLALAVQAASAQTVAVKQPVPILLGTTGACNNVFPGGPCTQTSTLVQIDPRTGALLKTIGPVGFTVNGLAWDKFNRKLYASTAIGDVTFHGLITIDTVTGRGTPVNPAAVNFGLPGDPSPVHSITIDSFGNMAAWYDEVPGPGITDTFVKMNQKTGVATEFNNTGIDSNQNGLAFQTLGLVNLLWNIDGVKRQPDGTVSQTAYLLDPRNGQPILSRALSPPTMAALGDFHPYNLKYYGLQFVAFDPSGATSINVVDVIKGTVTPLAATVPNLHVLAFIP